MSEQKKMDALNIAQMIKDHQSSWALRQEMINIVAKEIKDKFDALVEAGFTQEQALELCKAKAL